MPIILVLYYAAVEIQTELRSGVRRVLGFWCLVFNFPITRLLNYPISGGGTPTPRFHPFSPKLTQRHPRISLGEANICSFTGVPGKPGFGLLGWNRGPRQARVWLAGVEGHPGILGAHRAPSCSAAVEKSAEARRLRDVIPKMQNPASSRVVKNACLAQPLLAVQLKRRKYENILTRFLSIARGFFNTTAGSCREIAQFWLSAFLLLRFVVLK